MRIITASHITDWANRQKRDCQGTLPILIRKLVHATASRIDRIDFPGGDAVSDEGWDGRLNCKSESPFVPDGVSGWEIGTDRSAVTKADDDYDKRVEDPLDLNPETTSYVFVTPRTWAKRHKWEREKNDAKQWHHVRVIAAGDLEQWLQCAPAVALWLARHLQLAPASGLIGLEDWWDEWAARTRPNITPLMLLGGREAEIEKSRHWLEAPASGLEIQADAPHEAIAFLLASSTRWPKELREALLSRCVVAMTEDAVRAAAAWSTPLVIVAPAGVAQPSAGALLQRGHHLYLAVGRALASRSGGPTRLPRVDRLSLERAITEAGLERETAAQIVAECGRSIAVLHRRRSAIDAIRRPPWAEAGQGELLVPALLAGAWTELLRPSISSPLGPASPQLLDRAVLCRLSSLGTYDDVVAPVRRLSASDDPPFQHAAGVWRLTAPLDAWYLLGDFIQAHHLERLEEVAIEVLRLVDPKYELPEDKQWMAATLGKERVHSDWLREGLSISLAIVAQHGEVLRLPIPYGTARGFVHGVAQRVFSQLCSWQGWASLGNTLPILAEAAPDAFLNSIDIFMNKYPKEVDNLLSDGGNEVGITGECRHAELLWALERLSWHPEYLSQSCLLLGRLDKLDPGGRWGNRPFNSLCEVLIGPSNPFTFADADQCLQAIDALISDSPETAWKLLLRGAQPLGGRTVRDPPIFLEARPDEWSPWSTEQHEHFWTGLSARVERFVSQGSRVHILDALGHLSGLPANVQSRVAAWLDSQELMPVHDGADQLWAAVRAALRRCKSTRSGRAFAPGLEEALTRANTRLLPSDPMIMSEWLFGKDRPQLAEVVEEDWQENERILIEHRARVVRQLLDDLGIDEFLAWSAKLPDQTAFGWTLASAVTDAEDLKLAYPMLSLVQTEADTPPILLRAYIARRHAENGTRWLDQWLAVAATCKDAAAASAAALSAIPVGPESWRLAEGLGSEVADKFWRWVPGYLDRSIAGEDLEHATDRFLSVSRPDAVLRSIALRSPPSLPAALLLKVGQSTLQLLNATDGHVGAKFQWEVEQLFEHLDKAEGVVITDLAALEWSFLFALLHSQRQPRALHQLLAADPQLFCQLICCVWKADDDEQEATEENDSTPADHEVNRAKMAWELLDSWRGPLPGQTEDGIDFDTLNGWVARARQLCRDAHRSKIGDIEIGKLLAYAPNDSSDGHWPHSTVRRLLETLHSAEIDDGFRTEIFNSRGVTVRGLRDGGDQERVLVDRYRAWATAILSSTPHTAGLLKRVADGYEADAKQEDERAKLNDLR